LTFVYTCYAHKGSFVDLYSEVKDDGVVAVLYRLWPSPFNPEAWKMIFSYMAFELFLMKAVPGKTFKAAPTVTGHVPVYNANGFESYLITIATLVVLTHQGIIHPETVYDKMGELLSSMNLFAILLCCFLTIKGLNFPSTKDSGTNGSVIVDFFWGTELYPRVLGWDIKQFTNCRFGMMFWQVGILCYAYKQYTVLGYVSSSMLVSVVVQSVYVAKFFLWETGYFCTMDIQHDRAGYYICWGCLVWVPSMYTIHTYFLVDNPVLLSLPLATFFIVAGVYCVWVNYDCDRQRQEFRKTGGRVKIWGAEPDYIEAEYVTEDGKNHTSLLLASGWWGIARHFHYVPEILASFFWCVPALFTHPLPYFYPVYLTLLLVDRAWRDDARCAAKYGKYWDLYCAKVPSKIIPGVV
jgi:7-dehydrocholesterol reductase